MFAEEEVGGGEVSLDRGFADVIHVDAAAFEVLAGLALALAEAGMDQNFGEWQAGAFEALRSPGWALRRRFR